MGVQEGAQRAPSCIQKEIGGKHCPSVVKMYEGDSAQNKSTSHPKKLDNHKAAIALHFMHYNFSASNRRSWAMYSSAR